jgi:hypothetical protein
MILTITAPVPAIPSGWWGHSTGMAALGLGGGGGDAAEPSPLLADSDANVVLLAGTLTKWPMNKEIGQKKNRSAPACSPLSVTPAVHCHLQDDDGMPCSMAGQVIHWCRILSK